MPAAAFARSAACAVFAVRIAVMAAFTACTPVQNLENPGGPGLIVRYARDSPGRGATGSADPTRSVLRAVTLNTHFAHAIGRAIPLFRETPELRGADFILLQEMNDGGVKRLTHALSLNGVYFADAIHPVSRTFFGAAILTPWPVESAWKVALPHAGRFRKQRRAATGAVVRVAETRVRVYSVHLEVAYRLSEDARREQLQAVVDDAKRWTGPVVIGGDMNDEDVARFLEDRGYAWASREAGPTLGPLALDHILVRGMPKGAALRSGTVSTQGVSDHRAVWALFRLEERR